MPALTRGSSSNNGTGTSVSITTLPPPTASSLVLLAVGLNSSTITVSSITGGTGTFAQVAALASGSLGLELWVGYNFGTSQPTTITVTRGAGSANMAVTGRTIDLYADASTAPTAAASAGNTGTSTSPDSNTLTPAVGDLLWAAFVKSGTSASTARTHTGNSYINNVASAASTIGMESGWSDVLNAVSSKEVWTITSATWISIQVKLTPSAAPAAGTGWVVKGYGTAVLDSTSAA